jgi:hypothetical protein
MIWPPPMGTTSHTGTPLQPYPQNRQQQSRDRTAGVVTPDSRIYPVVHLSTVPDSAGADSRQLDVNVPQQHQQDQYHENGP